MNISFYLCYLQTGVCFDWLWPQHAELRSDQEDPGSPAKPGGPAGGFADCGKTEFITADECCRKEFKRKAKQQFDHEVLQKQKCDGKWDYFIDFQKEKN